MDLFEFIIGTIVTLVIGLVMLLSIYKIWKLEDENPTEGLTPKE